VSAFLRKPLTPDMIEDSAHKALLEKGAAVVKPAAKATTPETGHVPNGIALFAKNVALFIASPIIGFVHVIALPLSVSACWPGSAPALFALAWHAGAVR
jgi:hypothetical protein